MKHFKRFLLGSIAVTISVSMMLGIGWLVEKLFILIFHNFVIFLAIIMVLICIAGTYHVGKSIEETLRERKEKVKDEK